MRGIKSRIIFVICIAALLLQTGCAKELSAAANTASQRVTRGDLVIGLGADGRVALPVSNLNFGVSGTVSKIYVKTGDSVKAGDLLAELDDTSYQFEIEGARNNLTKSQTSYDNAVSQYNYSILNDEKDLSKLKRTISEGFDDYTYQTAIADATTTLERRTEDLEKAREKAFTPFDPYTYDNQIAEAEKTLTARQMELDEAETALMEAFDDYTYQNTITEAKINLERKQAALKEAQAEARTFDSYQYDNAIANAETALSRRLQEYEDAQTAYYEAAGGGVGGAAYEKVRQAEAAYNSALSAYIQSQTEQNKTALDAAALKLSEAQSEYEKAVSSGETAAGTAAAKLTSAQNAYEDAQKALENAKKDLQRAKESYAGSGTSKTDSAKQAADDAQRQLDKAMADLARAVSQSDENKAKTYETAKEARINAEANLEKLKTDKARAETQAVKDAQDQLKTAEQSVKDAQTSLEKALTNLSRARADHLKQLEDTAVDLQLKEINADMNKNSNASISNALFTLEEAKLNLQEAEGNLEQVKLYAPIDGQVLSVSRSVGESVTAQNGAAGAVFFGTGNSGGSFMTISDVTKIYLTASITEGDIINIANGQEIRVTIDAIGDDVFTGTVTNVDSIPTTDANGITTYSVTCLLDNISSVIKDGMNAYITFMQREQKDVLLIPNRAVFMEDELQYVNVVLQDGSYEKRKVVCGLSNGVQTEVVSGLSEGETVLSSRISS